MSTTYPGTIQTFVDPAGTAKLSNPDHTQRHIDEADTIEAIQTVMGTTAGTSVLKNFAAGDFPARINASNVMQQVVSGTISSSVGTISNFLINSPKIGTALYDTGGNELIKVTATASAVNEVTLANAATGGNPTITASGGDDNVGIDLKPKGTATVRKPTSVILQVVNGATALTVGDGKAYFTVPEELNGMNLVGYHARVVTAGTTNATLIQLYNVTDSADMFSTGMTIASGSVVANVGTLNTATDDVATNDLLRVDVDSISTTPPQGLVLRFRFVQP